MKLVVDIGNSRMKWAWLERGALRDPGAVAHDGGVPHEAIAALRPHGQPDEILVANVTAPALGAAVIGALAEAFAAPVRAAETEIAAAGVRNGYVEPRQLGVDRWLAMLAAYARFRRAVCVMDAGTALTVDAVAADGRHLGGLIIPGPALMRSALLGATGGIGSAADLVPAGRREPAQAAAGVWGRDTESCVRLGSLRAIDRLAESCMTALCGPGEPGGALVVTGGDAPEVLEGLTVPAEHRPLLVLEGLALRHGGP